MPSIKDLKKRITTVKNTQQTTRAMKMVSAAKLRRAQEAITSHRPYARRMGHLIQILSSDGTSTIRSPFLAQSGESVTEARKVVLLLVVTSDRGLCGGFNNNIIKAVQKWTAQNQSSYEKIVLGFVGKRGYDFFKTKKVNVGPYFQEAGGKVTFAKAKKLSETLTQAYLDGEYSEIKVVYNEFKNAVTQALQVESFLPLQATSVEAAEVSNGSAGGLKLEDYVVRPSTPELFSELIGKYFPVQTFRILLESQASEHGARMSAMENATKNAGEMIRKLTLLFNKQRQASITKELLEIISGSESQKAHA